MTESQINLVINKLTREQYDKMVGKNQINDNEFYYIIDDDEVLIRNVVNSALTTALADYVRTSDLANVIPVQANPQVASQENLTQLDNIQIGDVIYKVNELGGDSMVFSTDKVQTTPTRGLLRSTPQQEVLTLRSINIGNDTWKVGDVSDVEDSLSELEQTVSDNKTETDTAITNLENIVYAEDPSTGNLTFVYTDNSNQDVERVFLRQ